MKHDFSCHAHRCLRLAALGALLVPPAALAEPTVRFSIEPRIGLERTSVPDGLPSRHEFRFELSEPLAPDETVTVDVRSSVRQAVNQYDLFTISVDGMAFPEDADPAGDFTVIRYTLEQQVAVLTIDFFPDPFENDGSGGGGTS
ncbi:MAG: hypothetical protein AAGD86_01010, partial [Pseudomonadota bacterium]